MNFQTANEKLNTGRKMSRKKVANNTYLVHGSAGEPLEHIHLQLHDTNIITWFADGSTILNSGGWRTVTTKARINEYVEGVGLAQKAGVWYVVKDGDILSKESPKYFDGIDISK